MSGMRTSSILAASRAGDISSRLLRDWRPQEIEINLSKKSKNGSGGLYFKKKPLYAFIYIYI